MSTRRAVSIPVGLEAALVELASSTDPDSSGDFLSRKRTSVRRKTCSWGWLTGFCFDQKEANQKQTSLLSLLRASEELGSTESAALVALGKVSSLLPPGIEIVGVYAAGPGARQKVRSLAASCPCTSSDLIILAAADVSEDGSTMLSYQSCECSHRDLVKEEKTHVHLSQLERMLDNHIKIRCSVDLHCPAYDTASRTWAEHVEAAAEQLQSSLASRELAFLMPGGGEGKGGEALVLRSGSASAEGSIGGHVPKESLEVFAAEVFEDAAVSDRLSELRISGAPSALYSPASADEAPAAVKPLCFRLDSVCYVPSLTPLGEVAGRFLLPGLLKQIKPCAKAIAQHDTLREAQVFQFLVPETPFHIAVAYKLPPSGSSEDVDELNLPRRRELHRILGLPLDRPMLRLSNACREGSGGGANPGTSRLADVHIGLTSPKIDGRVSLVSGSYDYYHYMQDRTDDSGWGCAYRSLQTIMSWFRRQHYTSKPVLSHREIQQTLVDVGDKPSTFVGSREWIGAIELSYVLDSYLQVTSKIITVSSGSDMPSKAWEISNHFETQGTPIMVGLRPIFFLVLFDCCMCCLCYPELAIGELKGKPGSGSDL
uniref:Peptidase ubiquitin fold modifier-specific peptidase 1 2 isoform 1 n=1 Tax=Tetraselmis sp. GSL018 TaxID=582737 RepID=A0A061QT33_9CHLO